MNVKPCSIATQMVLHEILYSYYKMVQLVKVQYHAVLEVVVHGC